MRPCDICFRDSSSRISKAEEECNRLQTELTSARRRGASLDADFHSKERTVNQLRTKVAVLEQVGRNLRRKLVDLK